MVHDFFTRGVHMSTNMFFGKTLQLTDKSRSDVEFFTPFPDAAEAGCKALSIIASPFAFTVGSGYLLLNAGWKLLLAIKDACCLDFEAAEKNIVSCGENFGASLLCLISVLLAPIINLIDFLGSAINTAIEAYAEAPAPAMKP
jgi:hypothetical protein